MYGKEEGWGSGKELGKSDGDVWNWVAGLMLCISLLGKTSGQNKNKMETNRI